MTEPYIDPQLMAARVLTAIRENTMRSARARQQAEHRIGASEIGLCRSYLKYMTIGTEYDPREDPKWPAFIGTAIGDHVESAYKAIYPNSIIQADFESTLPSGKVIPCHSDVIDQDLNALVDVKTKDGLGQVLYEGKPSRQYRYQVAIYLLGAIQAGLLKPGARAYLVYLDRSGKEYTPCVIEVEVDDALYVEIDDWIEDAMYAVQYDVEAPKDQPYNFCEAACPFFSTCRGGETLAEGLIEDEEAAAALKARIAAMAEIKRNESIKESADTVLRPYAETGGYIVTDDGPYELSTTVIGASSFTVDRKESVRMNVRKKRVK